MPIPVREGSTGRLAGRKVLITGAATGIGQAISQLFAAEGARLALLDIAEVAAPTGGVSFRCDVSDEDHVHQAVAAAEAELGGLDGLVNAAGIMRRALVEDQSTQDWRRTMEVNLYGPYFVARAALPALRRAGRGTVVNIASIGALRPGKGVTAYSSSKAGLMMLTKCLAAELGPDIRVNSVCPGTVATGLTQELLSDAATAQRLAQSPALQRLGQADEIARAVLYLTSDDSSYSTGTNLVVDGGYCWQ